MFRPGPFLSFARTFPHLFAFDLKTSSAIIDPSTSVSICAVLPYQRLIFPFIPQISYPTLCPTIILFDPAVGSFLGYPIATRPDPTSYR